MTKVWSLCIALCISLAFAGQASAAGRLFHTNEPVGTIEELNPDTGAVINSYPTPTPIGDGCSGLAFANNRLFFQDCGSSIFELNPATGAVINSFPSPSPTIDGLGFSGALLYLQDYAGGGAAKKAAKLNRATPYGVASGERVSPSAVAPAGGLIYVINPDTGATIRVLTPGVFLYGGLTFAGGRNTLFASDVDAGMVYEIDPFTGAVKNSFAAPVAGIFGLGYSFSRRTLFLGDVGANNNTIYEVNPDTGAVIHTLPVAPNWSLAADENGTTTVPTMNEWGMILFTTLAGLGSVSYLKRKKTTKG